MLILTALPKLVNKLSEEAMDSYAEEVVLSVVLTIANILLWFKWFVPIEGILEWIIVIIGFIIIESVGMSAIIKLTTIVNTMFANITEYPAETFDSVITDIRTNSIIRKNKKLFKFKDAEVGLKYFLEDDDIRNVSKVTFL
jgi:hypothetical protein